MNRVLGSGGSTNMLTSSSAAAGATASVLAQVEPRFGDREPADEVRREPAGLHRRQHSPHLVDERQPHGVLRGRDLDRPQPALVTGRSASPRRFCSRNTSTPRSPCGRRTGRARTGRARPRGRHRTGGRRGWSVSASGGSAPGGGPSPAEASRPLSELGTVMSSIRAAVQAVIWVPAVRDDLFDVGQTATALRLPVASTNRAAASTLGPMDSTAGTAGEPSSSLLLSMSSASPPRHSPTTMRSGRMRSAFLHEVADRVLALALDVGGRVSSDTTCGCLQLELGGVLDRDDALVARGSRRRAR